MERITVIVQDQAARKAVEEFLAAESPDACRVIAPGSVPQTGVVLCVGPGLEDIPGGQNFKTPLRIGALLDRVHSHLSSRRKNEYQNFFFFGAYSIDCVNNELKHGESDAVITLTEKEKSILRLLAVHNGAVVARRTLLDEVWGYGENIETHTLETHIYRLRQKIEKNPAAPLLLVTEESGYRLKV